MKKLFAMFICTLLILPLFACNQLIEENTLTGANMESGENRTGSEEHTYEKGDSTLETAEWRLFLKDYETWVDNYLELIANYTENPADMSILSDYTKMEGELRDWSTRAEAIKDELEDASLEELQEYSAELVRIASKLAGVDA